MLIATDFAILRDVPANCRARIPLERQPLRLVTLIDEAAFKAYGNAIIHRVTGYIEDQMHDWSWHKGVLRYYTRITEKSDLLIVYAEREDERTRFCIHCGADAKQGCEHQPKADQLMYPIDAH